MATTPTQVRIDTDIKKEATALFAKLGLDMSGAVNLFLHQCVLHGGLPFAVEIPRYSEKLSAQWLKQNAFPVTLTSRDIPTWTN